VSITANAAGLKICLLPIEKMNFEVIAHSAAHPKKGRKEANCKECEGVIIRDKMRAVMNVDSEFTGAPRMDAHAVFTAQHITTMVSVERKSAIGVKENTPKKLNRNETASSNSR